MGVHTHTPHLPFQTCSTSYVHSHDTLITSFTRPFPSYTYHILHLSPPPSHTHSEHLLFPPGLAKAFPDTCCFSRCCHTYGWSTFFLSFLFPSTVISLLSPSLLFFSFRLPSFLHSLLNSLLSLISFPPFSLLSRTSYMTKKRGLKARNSLNVFTCDKIGVKEVQKHVQFRSRRQDTLRLKEDKS